MRHGRADPRERRLEFWIGFTGWFALNGLVELAIVNLMFNSSAGGAVAATLLGVNILAPIVLIFYSRPASLGVLTAFGCALGITVIEGVINLATDFAYGVGLFNISYLVSWLGLLAIGAYKIWRARRQVT